MADGRPAWRNSTRRARLPGNWYTQIRPAVLERDAFWCRLRFEGRCTVTATDVDHVRPGDDHSMENLQAACGPCHRHKSSLEGAAAARVARGQARRPPEAHPAFR